MLLLSIQQKFNRFDIKVCCVISINLETSLVANFTTTLNVFITSLDSQQWINLVIDMNLKEM